jgi:hypothetical protein
MNTAFSLQGSLSILPYCLPPLLSLTFGIIFLLNDPRNIRNRVFALAVFCVAFQGIYQALMLGAITASQAIYPYPIFLFCVCLYTILFTYFAALLYDQKKYAGIAFPLLLLLPVLFFLYVQIRYNSIVPYYYPIANPGELLPKQFYAAHGHLFPLYYFYIICMPALTIYFLFNKYYDSQTRVEKNIYRALIIGLYLPFIGSWLGNYILKFLQIPVTLINTTQLGFLLLFALVYYLVKKYGLLLGQPLVQDKRREVSVWIRLAVLMVTLSALLSYSIDIFKQINYKNVSIKARGDLALLERSLRAFKEIKKEYPAAGDYQDQLMRTTPNLLGSRLADPFSLTGIEPYRYQLSKNRQYYLVSSVGRFASLSGEVTDDGKAIIFSRFPQMEFWVTNAGSSEAIFFP